VTRLKAAGVELAAMGETHLEESDDTELVTFVDASRGTYQKLVLREGRIVGAILLGDTRSAGTVTQLFDRGSAAPHDRATLLLASARSADAETPTRIPDRANVCQCNGVTKAAIRQAWQSGARTVADVVHPKVGVGFDNAYSESAPVRRYFGLSESSWSERQLRCGTSHVDHEQGLRCLWRTRRVDNRAGRGHVEVGSLVGTR